MKKITNLTNLLSQQLKELLHAEKQQQESLQKIIKKTESNELKQLFQKNINKTEKQAKRLEDALSILGEDKKVIECKAMKELLGRGLDLTKKCDNAEVLEAGLISSLQCIKHFEIAEYGTMASFAKLLGNDEVLEILKKTIAEEKAIDKELTELAERTINKRAQEPETIAV